MLTQVAQIYAVSLGASFGCLLLIRFLPCLQTWLALGRRLALQHLVFPQLLRRHRHLGPWSPADVLVHVCYVAVNAFCLGFKVASLGEAGARAAQLSLVNMAPAFAGPHLGFLADILGVSQCTFRRMHRSAGTASVLLLAVHVATFAASQTPFPLHVAQNMWALVGASSLCLLLVLSLPVLRRPSYELFLRAHQALALLSVFSIWYHLWFASFFPRMVVYISSALFLSMLTLQSLHFLYRNMAQGATLSRAYVACAGDAVKVRLVLSRPVRVEAGQYIELWMPAAGFCAFLQSHPFTVVSWSEHKQGYLDLLVQPRKGLTRRLLELSKADNIPAGEYDRARGYIDTGSLKPRHALFSGPHGLSVPVGDYETVVMIASDFGIASQLPYLRQLVYGYNRCKTRNRRIRLVWLLGAGQDITAAEVLVNSVLVDDAQYYGYILGISIFVASGHQRSDESRGQRVMYHYAKVPDFAGILLEERNYAYVNRARGFGEGNEYGEESEPGEKNEHGENSKQRGDMAVLVSANGTVRDEIRKHMRSYAKQRVKLFELEYQPADSPVRPAVSRENSSSQPMQSLA